MRTAALLLLSLASLPAKDNGLLQWMDAIAQRQLDSRAAQIAAVRTASAAARRQQYVRSKILELIGGLPDYNGPLNARIGARLEHPGYVIENVVFETLPRVWVAANLYRPTAPGPHPGILLPLGHWEQGKPAVQRLAANFALKGFVVLAYDPFGQGERLQAYDQRLGRSIAGGATDQHFMAGAQSLLIGQSFARYRVWDARRALDYLTSRPEVDPARIGCTGCSGGGTVTAFISALDPRIKVAAPACYMNSFRSLFSGAVGDSEQSLPDFLSSGLDQTDFVELFAPKPWLISSTIDDFFKLEGARQVYQEARSWYRIYGAADKIHWEIGQGGHGTPLEIREAIYAWMIRWLKNGAGDSTEQSVDFHPDFELRATKSGQVATEFNSREIDELIRADFDKLKRPGTQQAMLAALRRWSPDPPPGPVDSKLLAEARTPDLITRRLSFESEPGIELRAALLLPRKPGRKPGVLLVETQAAPSPLAIEIARAGAVVLSLPPRGKPLAEASRPLLGDWLANTRAWLIGRNLPGLRAFDIRRGIDLLLANPEVDPTRIRGAAGEAAGVWLLIAAALDSRIGGLWLDRTPNSLRAALNGPFHRNLHDAILPGFILHWDIEDLVTAIRPRPVLRTDPTDWMGTVLPLGPGYLYRHIESTDQAFIESLLR